MKRRYYPLLVKAGIGIFAAIGIAIAWQKKGHLSMGFLGIALIILVFALLLMADMLSRFKFCGKCGATNMYWFSMMPARSIWYQDRSRCRKCGNPF
ncbi:MAG: hypothetical protein H6Q07_2218 [Acidobacteria bacterium]|nr:hypothetical protein [Acidobacteriota bacterium]